MHADIKNKIKSVAISEERRWTKDHKKIKESDMLETLTRYWKSIVCDESPLKKYRNINPKNRAIASSKNKSAWSAAFICYVLRASGVRSEDGFEYSRRHITYIVKAVMNREEFRMTGVKKDTFFYFDKSEFDENSGDELFESICTSDLICLNRKRKKKKDKEGKLTNHTIRSLSKFDDLEKVRDVSHCDIVVDKLSKGGSHFITTIGGNVLHSVSKKTFEIKDNKIYRIINSNRRQSHGKRMTCSITPES